MPNTILFLCTGNYYRSRFAEILFNTLARERKLDWVADSRGLRLEPLNPGPISRFTLTALNEMGIRLEDPIRYPMPVLARDFEQSHRVVAVKEAEHRPLIQQFFPAWLDRVEFWTVDDIDYAEPEIAIPELRDNVIALVDQLMQAAHM
ncbi:MAG: low molecular weight phosphatase family protein [Planctomycetes bacterium]|nr:low molecular weight phosphatase family protein [Planctomycetota bacterium]